MCTRWASLIISMLLAVGLPALAAPMQGSGGQKHKVEHPPSEMDKALPAKFATLAAMGDRCTGAMVLRRFSQIKYTVTTGISRM